MESQIRFIVDYYSIFIYTNLGRTGQVDFCSLLVDDSTIGECDWHYAPSNILVLISTFKSDPLLLNQVVNKLFSRACVDRVPDLIHFYIYGSARNEDNDLLLVGQADHSSNVAYSSHGNYIGQVDFCK